MAIKKLTKAITQETKASTAEEPLYVLSYARYSSENQREESIDVQQASIRDYCQRKGYICLGEYADRAISGRTDNRPEFQQMITQALSDDRVKIVIIHRLDRFFRNNELHYQYKNRLNDNGIRLVSVCEDFDDTAEGEMSQGIFVNQSDYFSKQLARNVFNGLKENAKKAKHAGGKPPYGYMILNKKMKIRPQEAKAVQKMFQMVDAGFSYNQIIEQLYKEGYRSTSKDGRFKKTTITAMLRNEKYMGTYFYNKANRKNSKGQRTKKLAKKPEEIIWKEDGCPAIVTEDLFYRVQEKLNSRSRGSHGAKYFYPLSDSGVLFCQNCGKPMRGNFKLAGRNKTPYATYVCNGHRDHSCTTKDIQTKYVEDFVFDYLRKFLFSDKMKPHLLKLLSESEHIVRVEDKQTLKNYQIELKETEKEFKALVKAAKSSDEVSEDLSDELRETSWKKRDIQNRIEEIKNRRANRNYTLTDIDLLEERFIDYLKNNDTLATRRFLREMIERIEIGEENIEVTLHIA